MIRVSKQTSAGDGAEVWEEAEMACDWMNEREWKKKGQ